MIARLVTARCLRTMSRATAPLSLVLVSLALFLASPAVAQPPEGSGAAESKATADIADRMIIPPPLEDLGRDYKIRLVYFVPSDCEVKENYRQKIEVLMRVVADIYRREMKSNGLNSRGLDFEFEEEGESDEQGKLKVFLVKGREPAVFYRGEPVDTRRMRNTQTQEIWENTGFSRNRAVLVWTEVGSIAEASPIPQHYSGFAYVSGDMLRDEITELTIEEQIENLLDTTPVQRGEGDKKQPRNAEPQVANGVLIHELGHIFGMLHDSANVNNVMYYGYHHLGRSFDSKTAASRPVRFSPPHARMAAATRFLSEKFDAKDREGPTIHEFSRLEPPKVGDETVRFKLKLSDNAGLSTLVCMQRGGEWNDALVGDIDFKGEKEFEKTVTFTCPRPLGKSKPVMYWINVIDVNGNLSQQQIGWTQVLQEEESGEAEDGG